MGIARKCDRCGSLYELYDGIGFTDANLSKWDGMMLTTRFSNSRNRDYDLCPYCMRALLSFINDGNKKEIPIICKSCDTCIYSGITPENKCKLCSPEPGLFLNWEAKYD